MEITNSVILFIFLFQNFTFYIVMLFVEDLPKFKTRKGLEEEKFSFVCLRKKFKKISRL